MRQAIVTKYLGPTNHRGARVKATAQAGSVTIAWDHALETDYNHLSAAIALANKYSWLVGHSLEGGAMPSGDGNCYVLLPHP